MIRLLGIVATCGALMGCSTATQVADTLVRDQAKAAVNGVVSSQFPTVDVSPVTDCIIDGASSAEILTIATNAASERTSENVSLVLDIAQRPAVTECIAQQAMNSILMPGGR
ncbi:succinate dehydrogenase [Roseobacteraceae bacterium S113]